MCPSAQMATKGLLIWTSLLDCYPACHVKKMLGFWGWCIHAGNRFRDGFPGRVTARGSHMVTQIAAAAIWVHRE